MNRKVFFSHSATTILIICAVIITVLIIRRELFPPTSVSNERAVNDWQNIEFLGSPYNPEKGKVQIFKFYDYECPYCKLAAPPLKAVSKAWSDVVTVKYVHFPLEEIHPLAWDAAIAAECARNQEAFESYHTILFERQEEINTFSYIQLAEEVGIEDIPLFEKCIRNQETSSIVEEGVKLAERLQISSIPTFLINGTQITGVLSEQQLNSYIEEALADCEAATCD